MSKGKQKIKDSQMRYKKGLGQNFIYDEELLTALVSAAAVDDSDCVFEIGPGAGTLTKALALRARKVLALEIDERLIPLLRGYLSIYSNVTILEGDVLSVNLHEITKPLGDDFMVVANIPYYITTPLIMLLLDSNLPIKRIAMMVQKEVSEKMLAEPGSEGYGLLAVKCQYYGKVHVAMEIPKECFTPVPKVDSTFVIIDLFQEKPVQAKNEKIFFKTVQAAFLMRRKTMQNNLQSAFAISKEKAKQALLDTGLDEKIRGEKLSLEEFAKLSEKL